MSSELLYIHGGAALSTYQGVYSGPPSLTASAPVITTETIPLLAPCRLRIRALGFAFTPGPPDAVAAIQGIGELTVLDHLSGRPITAVLFQGGESAVTPWMDVEYGRTLPFEVNFVAADPHHMVFLRFVVEVEGGFLGPRP